MSAPQPKRDAAADGDSSLPVGAEFHSINGVSQSDALTASIEGRFVRFSA